VDGLECDLSIKLLNFTVKVKYRSVERNSTELRTVRKFLYNVGCKFENKITKPVMGVQEGIWKNYSNNIAKRSLYCLVC